MYPRVVRVVASSSHPPPSATTMEMVKAAKVIHRERLYIFVYGRNQKDFNDSPSTTSWVDDGSRLMSDHVYITAIKIRLDLIFIKLRMARGSRSATFIMCDVVHRRPVSLAHKHASVPYADSGKDETI